MKKRFRKGISLVLAAALVICMIPVVGATEVGTQNGPTYEYVFTSGALNQSGTYVFANAFGKTSVSGGKWSPIGVKFHTSSAFFDGGYRFSISTSGTRKQLGKNGTVFKITVDESGMYHPSLSYFTISNGCKIKVYLSETDASDYFSEGSYDAAAYIAAIVNGSKSGEILFSGSVNTYEKEVEAEYDEENKETEQFEDVTDFYLEKDKSYYLVVAVDGAETEKIYTELPSSIRYNLYSFGLTKVETAEEDATVSQSISFVATSNVGTNDMMTVTGTDYDEFVDKIPAGTYVTVTAPEKAGYEFKHWVRGSRDNGVYVSDESSYSFTALTNTFLTAIYEETVTTDGTTAVVEFYNGNGQYLEKATAKIGGTVELPETAPSLTGFAFANQWKSEDGIFTSETPLARKLTRAVAQFNALDTTFNVTDHNGDVHKLTYGMERTFTSADAVYWLRDDKVVDYGTSYTYAAWDDTVITTATTGEIKPLVVLDPDAKNGARMIEYDDGGKNLIEVGIIFGTSADIEISSCSSKATSQENAAHGQFTAKPNGTELYARGYLIYKDGSDYKVVYSK